MGFNEWWTRREIQKEMAIEMDRFWGLMRVVSHELACLFKYAGISNDTVTRTNQQFFFFTILDYDKDLRINYFNLVY